MGQRKSAKKEMELRPEEILLGEALAQFYALLEQCEFDPARYLQRPKTHPREASSDTAHFIRLKGGKARDLVPAARIFQLWYCDPRYLSDSGAPLPLPLSGAVSLSTLFEASACRFDPKLVRDTLLDERLVDRHGEFTRPLTRVVLGKGSMRSKQVMYSLRDLMATLNFNMRADESKPKRFQRFVFDTKVPAARVEEFEKFLETQALEFLFMVEEWMLTAERQASPGEQMLPMNVHLFSSAPDGVDVRALTTKKPTEAEAGAKAGEAGTGNAKRGKGASAKSKSKRQREKRNGT